MSLNTKFIIIIVNVLIISVKTQNTTEYEATTEEKSIIEEIEDSENETSIVPLSNGINEEICGTSNALRIVGGSEAQAGQYPWMAALMHNYRTLPGCGGILINRQFILTAAHCINNRNKTQFSVILGAHHFTNESEVTAKQFEIEEWVKHEKFILKTYDFDIAIIKINSTVDYSNRIRPICLPHKNSFDPIGKNATTAGWGRVKYIGVSSPVLRHVNVEIWSLDKCLEAYSNYSLKMNKDALCAANPNSDSCSGDSGGPLMIENTDKRWLLIGIVSWGHECAHKKYPGVYTRVRSYIDWIEKTIKSIK